MKVGVRELKNRLSHYLDLVGKGEHVTVTERGRDIAVITPLPHSEVERKIGLLVKEGIATWGGGKPIGSASPAPSRGRRISDIVIEDRR